MPVKTRTRRVATTSAGKKRDPGGKKSRAAMITPAGRKAKFPAGLRPMLATLVDKPFDDKDWLYEVKWDGYRAMAFLNRGKVDLRSRNNKTFNEKFYPVTRALQELELSAVLDGEIIVSDDQGVANFSNLQNWRSEDDGELSFYVFDLLWLEGYSLLQLPLTERRRLLLQVLPSHPLIRISQSFPSTGLELFEAAKKLQLEGIIAKKADSDYKPGIRSREWLKIKTGKRHEVVIGGFTNNKGSNKTFSALLVGVHENGKFVYTGKIGTGFSAKTQKELMKAFQPLITTRCPFEKEPDVNKPSRFRPDPPQAKATWLKPKLVCEVSYTELTSDGVMRHPSFEGMRSDKAAKEVGPEKASPARAVKKRASTVLHRKKVIRPGGPKQRKSLLNPNDETQERSVNGQKLKFTNLSKIYWPKDRITKRDMLNYYYQVAPFILPYLKDRPQSLNRHPNGINGESFYQKDVTGKVPAWISTFPYKSENDSRQKHFMVCTNEASLLYMASLGCIEMNPWSSRVQSPDHPDWCIIDLDPDKNSFDQVIETARVTKQVLDAAKLPSYCKTSGSTGLHIYIPLQARYSYEASREFGRLIATLVHHELPQFTSIERPTAKRRGKIYIDFLQNRPQATLASAYSLRPKPGATVSMPLHWEEVKSGLSIKDFTIHNAMARLNSEGDIFKPVIGKGINMEKALKQLK